MISKDELEEEESIDLLINHLQIKKNEGKVKSISVEAVTRDLGKDEEGWNNLETTGEQIWTVITI